MENIGGGGTLERIVGTIVVSSGTVNRAQLLMGIFLFDVFAGSGFPTAAALQVTDTYQRKDCLWTGVAIAPNGGIDFGVCVPRVHHVDWRSRRKLGQGLALNLMSTAVINVMRVSFHLRMLVSLP